jgi:N-acetylglutamate synthase-like GNAT family acetyltransferase
MDFMKSQGASLCTLRCLLRNITLREPTRRVYRVIRIEPFNDHLAEEVSALILRNVREINSRNYPAAFIDLLILDFSPASLLEKAKRQFTYVAKEDDKIVGTAGLENQGEPDNPEYYAVAMFVLPEYHGQRIGKKLMRVVESKAVELGAEKLTLRAAINAPGFYQKMGYHFVDGVKKIDEWGNILLKKRK